MSKDESVLCLPAEKLHKILNGISVWVEGSKYQPSDPSFFPAHIFGLNTIVSLINELPIEAAFVSRSSCERDTNLRQLCSYSVLNTNGKIFSYERGKSGGENRLHHKRSIGVGGHINNSKITLPLTSDHLCEEMLREVEEEVEFVPLSRLTNKPPEINFVGLICDLNPENEVDAVHAGLVFEIMYSPGQFEAKEDCISTPLIHPLEIIQDCEWENWSGILMNVMSPPDLSFFKKY